MTIDWGKLARDRTLVAVEDGKGYKHGYVEYHDDIGIYMRRGYLTTPGFIPYTVMGDVKVIDKLTPPPEKEEWQDVKQCK